VLVRWPWIWLPDRTSERCELFQPATWAGPRDQVVPPGVVDPDTLDVVGIDAEGYGFPEHQRTLARLMSDVRVLSPAGVERAAMGWDLHVGKDGHQGLKDAEKAALHAVEKADRGPAWDEVRRSLFGLTESGAALISWKAEHGDIGHKAEDAAFAAALGLVAGDLISKQHTATLTRPMAEALPWLLPDEAKAEP
jgi:hypothetical protein